MAVNVNRIQELLKEHDMTQKELAEKAKIGQATVTEIIKLKRTDPSIKTVAKIAKVFKVKIEELI